MASLQQPSSKVPVLRVHGTISYDFLYRSRIDTPFQQADFRQHTERVQLSLTYKDRYPIRVQFTARQSNGPFFRNFGDLGLSFDRTAFLQSYRQRLLNAARKSFTVPNELSLLDSLLEKKKKLLSSLRAEVNHPENLQKLVEERERAYYASKHPEPKGDLDSIVQLPKPDFFRKVPQFSQAIPKLPADSIGIASSALDQKKRQVDSLSKQIAGLQRRADSLRTGYQTKVRTLEQKIAKARTLPDLRHIALTSNLSAPSSSIERALSGIKNISLGRSILDYSELTVQNLAVTGINVEYQAGLYTAFAAGRVDYRFRDFFTATAPRSGQYIVMGRIGIGDPDKKAIIITALKGRKNQFEFALPGNYQNHLDLVNFSIQGIVRKDAYTDYSIEVAKSTKPYPTQDSTQKLMAGFMRLDDATNFAVNLRGRTRINATRTQLSGFFRKAGRNFQSFSLFNYGSDQTAWQLNATQSFWHDHMTVTGALRQNDFAYPWAEQRFTSSAVFKSITVQAQFPKYPIVSFGYYPGTQVLVVDNKHLVQYAYYIVNGSAFYRYNAGSLSMQSGAVYNRYVNKATDSSFSRYRGTNLFLTQTLFFRRLDLQGDYTLSNQEQLIYHTYGAQVSTRLWKFLTLEAGGKFNKVADGKGYWGGLASGVLNFGRVGTLQLEYDKSFYPMLRNDLFPVETGRVTWFKTF